MVRSCWCGSPFTTVDTVSMYFLICSSKSFSQSVLLSYSLSSERPVSHSGVVSSASASPLIIIVLFGSTPSASYLCIVDLFTPIRLPSSGIVRFNSVRRSFTRSPTCFAVNVISFFKVYTSYRNQVYHTKTYFATLFLIKIKKYL